MTCLEVFCIVSETLLTFNQGKNIVCEYIINSYSEGKLHSNWRWTTVSFLEKGRSFIKLVAVNFN